MAIWPVNFYMLISSIKGAGELNTTKSTSQNSTGSKQANPKCQQQLSSTDFAAKTLLDLHEKNQLTLSEVKDQKDALSALITVCNNTVCMQCYTLLLIIGAS